MRARAYVVERDTVRRCSGVVEPSGFAGCRDARSLRHGVNGVDNVEHDRLAGYRTNSPKLRHPIEEKTTVTHV